eukprot:TRINITY_DN8619_c0_g1_i1.p1 TRINITY_DN8619_c0_g1~~TRINITY_DN8619_c0_g1_i1.p1  ORF type:complete len:239 (+),score=30.41 TRINITY_DN8619_c0_g1_i1:199-915(+)
MCIRDSSKSLLCIHDPKAFFDPRYNFRIKKIFTKAPISKKLYTDTNDNHYLKTNVTISQLINHSLAQQQTLVSSMNMQKSWTFMPNCQGFDTIQNGSNLCNGQQFSYLFDGQQLNAKEKRALSKKFKQTDYQAKYYRTCNSQRGNEITSSSNGFKKFENANQWRDYQNYFQPKVLSKKQQQISDQIQTISSKMQKNLEVTRLPIYMHPSQSRQYLSPPQVNHYIQRSENFNQIKSSQC